MLLLSGAFFPVQSAHWTMQWLMAANPLFYGIGALRHTLYGMDSAAVQGLPSLAICMTVTVVFALVTFALGTLMTMRRTSRDAR